MPERYYRRIIRVRGEDSPSVKKGIAEMRSGRRAPHPVLVLNDRQPWGVFTQEEYDRLKGRWDAYPESYRRHLTSQLAPALPGVLTIEDYCKRRATWDKVRQTVGLDGLFYEGAALLLWPPEWLDRCARVHESLRGKGKRTARGIGIDPGEGTANTAMSAVDDEGLFCLESRKTPNTAAIIGESLAFAREHGCPPEQVCFDRGGGGQQIADVLREQGHAVRTVAFGSAVALEVKRGRQPLKQRKEIVEERYTYVNRRAAMYHEASLVCDPDLNPTGYGIPGDECGPQYSELRRQLAIMPKLTDREGRYYLPPKNKRDSKDTTVTLTEMLGGSSPDEADSFVVAYYAKTHLVRSFEAGAVT